MTEKKPQPGRGLAEGLSAVGLELIKGNSRLFPKEDKIYILGAKLTPMTVTSERGFTGLRLRRKKGGEGKTKIKFEGHTINLPDLEAQIVDGQFGVLHRYVLVGEDALVDDGGSENIITEGFLFWG